MEEIRLVERIVAEPVAAPPTEDELPYDNGVPMETQRHMLQMVLLMDPLWLFWADRDDVFVGGNMFFYFSLDQVYYQDFQGPDFFVVLDVPKRERKSWVVWQEGKGPDVVIELLSESTANRDRGEKKLVYQNQLRVPEYYWYDPFTGELAGFALGNGLYEPKEPDDQGRLISRRLGLALVRWEGVYGGVGARWLRWATLDGDLLPTQQEVAEQERWQAWEAQQQAQEAQQQADDARQRAEELEARLARYRERFGELPE